MTDSFPFVSLWRPGIIRCLRCYSCVMLLEIELKRVQAHMSIMEMQQVSTNGNFAFDYALLVNMVISTSKRCPKSVTDCVVTHSSRHKKLASIVCAKIFDGRPRGIDTLTHHMRGMVFVLTEHEAKELCLQYCRPRKLLSRQNGESIKQNVSRRRRCWILLVQMGPVIHLSERHRLDMLLDLSSLTREERVVVQASIGNERDFDRVADARAIQHPRIHLRESQRRAKGKGKDGFKRVDNSYTRWFRGKGEGKHTGSGKSVASACHANFASVEGYDYDEDTNEPANAYQARDDSVDPGSGVDEEALDCDDDEENDTFSSYVALDDVTVHLNWTQLLILPSCGTMILTLK